MGFEDEKDPANQLPDREEYEAWEQEQAGWQPINTAPRDGSRFFGLYEGGEQVVRYEESRTCMLGSVAPGAGQCGPGFVQDCDGLPIDDPIGWKSIEDPTDICGLCGQPGADKVPHPERWPGEQKPDTDLVHSECEREECERAFLEFRGKVGRDGIDRFVRGMR